MTRSESHCESRLISPHCGIHRHSKVQTADTGKSKLHFRGQTHNSKWEEKWENTALLDATDTGQFGATHWFLGSESHLWWGQPVNNGQMWTTWRHLLKIVLEIIKMHWFWAKACVINASIPRGVGKWLVITKNAWLFSLERTSPEIKSNCMGKVSNPHKS